LHFQGLSEETEKVLKLAELIKKVTENLKVALKKFEVKNYLGLFIFL
jgi:hypothetical protein